MSRKERHFQGITREIRNFSENNYFKIIFFVSNNFVLLRAYFVCMNPPGRFTTRPLPVNLTTKLPFVRPFSILRKAKMGP